MKSATQVALVLSTAATTALVYLTVVSLNRRRKKKSNASDESSLPYPPSPPSRHWLLGHALSLQRNPNDPKVSHDLIFLDWNHKLNSKLVMFELPGLGRLINVSDPEVARYVLVAGNFRKSPTYRVMKPLIGKKSMVATEGEIWASQRKLYNPGFSPDFLKSCVSTIIEKCNRFILKCDADMMENKPTDMLNRAVDLTSDVIAQVAFGEDWGVDNDSNQGRETLNTIRDLTVVVGENMDNPLQRYFSIRKIWKTWRLSVALDNSMRALVQRRLDKLRDSTQDSFVQKDILTLSLSSILKSEIGNKSNRFSFSENDMENTTSQLKTFYFAGHDTTATTIAWAFWLLVKHPQILERVRTEVESHLGPSWVNQARTGMELHSSSYDAFQKCEYLDAICRETLRLYPPAATTRYITDSKASAGGYNLGNSLVHLNFYAIQRDPDVWEDANLFIPERFLGDEGRKRIASFSFLPFSKGMRDCIGKYFALLETKIALAALVSRYDADVVDANEVYSTRLTSIPLNGCKVILRHRE